MDNSDPNGADLVRGAAAHKPGALRVLLAAALTALLLDALACSLPTSAYQRWELAALQR